VAGEPKQDDEARHRLFLLATALIARGMKPAEAYSTAIHYIHGAGRGRTWIAALAEYEAANKMPQDAEPDGSAPSD
jgi:hypothetical protein